MRPGALFVALLLMLAACGGPSAWEKPAANTTCGDWLSQMTDDQRTEMAGTLFHSSMVASGVDAAQLTDEVITDELVLALRDQLTGACGAEAQVAALPGVMDRMFAAEIEQILQEIGDAINSPER